ncbi:cupin domain-containing protein [Corallococcus praedator]|uniref:cupin domain-containing protein n=1 Tax=Corallococcus praedator TaxID=2316724 RepID=UPI003F6DC4AC
MFAPHRHLGPAEIFILSGSTQDRMGITRPGDYEFEPLKRTTSSCGSSSCSPSPSCAAP